MKFYLAPMEAVTTYVYRNAYHRNFMEMNKYLTPFIAPNQNRTMNSREKNEVFLEHNRKMCVVPQILTGKADIFVRTANELAEMGYEEVNLNLGCPSATVVTRKRGAGLLEDREYLKFFLDEIYEQCRCKVSIKTRIGMEEPEEFEELLKIYRQFPLSELIVHPRTREEFYGGKPHWGEFEKALKTQNCMSIYNGDIFSRKDYEALTEAFPQLEAVMLGRGVAANPFLVDNILTGRIPDKAVLRRFHDELLEEYREISSGDTNALFKMKELWSYLATLFSEYEKPLKKIKKSQKMEDYLAAVENLFCGRELRKDG